MTKLVNVVVTGPWPNGRRVGGLPLEHQPGQSSQEPEQPSQPAATATPYDVIQHQVTPSRRCGGWCWLPFGTGQYLNGRPGKGALFTTLEVLSLGANVGLYWARVSDYDQRGYFEDTGSARTSYKLQAATLGVFAVALIAGVIDAYMFP